MQGKKAGPMYRFFSAFRFPLWGLLLIVFFASLILSVLDFNSKSIRFLTPKLQKIETASRQTYEVIACEVENAGHNRVWFQSGNDLTSISPKSCYPVDDIPESSQQDRHLGFYQWNGIKPGEKILLYLPSQAEGTYWVGIDVKDWIGRRHTISAFLIVEREGMVTFSRKKPDKKTGHEQEAGTGPIKQK